MPRRRTQPYRAGGGPAGPVLAAMLRGRPRYLPHPLDARRQAMKQNAAGSSASLAPNMPGMGNIRRRGAALAQALKQGQRGKVMARPLAERPGRRVGQYRKAGLTPPPPPGRVQSKIGSAGSLRQARTQARTQARASLPAKLVRPAARPVGPGAPTPKFGRQADGGWKRNPARLTPLRGRAFAATRGRGKKRGLRRRGFLR